MFTNPQVKALSSKLSAKYVHTHQRSCLTLSYIEVYQPVEKGTIDRVSPHGET